MGVAGSGPHWRLVPWHSHKRRRRGPESSWCSGPRCHSFQRKKMWHACGAEDMRLKRASLQRDTHTHTRSTSTLRQRSFGGTCSLAVVQLTPVKVTGSSPLQKPNDTCRRVLAHAPFPHDTFKWGCQLSCEDTF